MTEDRKAGPGSRPIDLDLFMAGGHRHQLTLPEGSPELRNLFAALAGGYGTFFQLPMKDGRAACSFSSSQVVSVITEPPVVVQLEAPQQERPAEETPVRVEQPPYAVIENFLSPGEVQDLLAFALANQEQFEPGTTGSKRTLHRENLVILSFRSSAQSTMLRNRMLTWFPNLAKTLGEPIFPLGQVESQLTANNDGHYYRLHDDSGRGETSPRVMTLVYYFHRQPKSFSGGELRLYDTVYRGEEKAPSESFRVVEPVCNRLVVFPSSAYHEVRPISCPSREFADSRFAVTTWIHRREEPDPEASFGWGQMHCGVVPPSFTEGG